MIGSCLARQGVDFLHFLAAFRLDFEVARPLQLEGCWDIFLQFLQIIAKRIILLQQFLIKLEVIESYMDRFFHKKRSRVVHLICVIHFKISEKDPFITFRVKLSQTILVVQCETLNCKRMQIRNIGFLIFPQSMGINGLM